MRRPLLVGALAAAVIALVASAAVAVGTLDGPSSGPSMMRGYGRGPMSGQGQISGPGMMGGQGQSPRGGMMGGSMMSSTAGMGMAWLPGDGIAVSSIPAARARAAKAAAPTGLHPGELIWFDNGFYVELKDSAGQAATEVIVDPRTGTVSTEPGPAMMWNTRIRMQTRGSGAKADAGAVDATKARVTATSWLAANRAGTTIGSIDAYPGYFTVDLKRNGVLSGMMSVNAFTGATWYHTWHGAFIAMEDS